MTLLISLAYTIITEQQTQNFARVVIDHDCFECITNNDYNDHAVDTLSRCIYVH